jgi:alginate O-acetyltransferase complex protein AlgI
MFVLFALAGALAYNLHGSTLWRQLVLLAMNLYFLSTFSRDPAAFIPLAAFVAVGYGAVRLMQAGRRGWFVPALVLEIGLLVWLKRYSFLPPSSLLPFSYVTLGLSYIAFRMLHVLIDAKDGTLPEVTLAGYLNYTLNFLTLVSGPIQRYEDFAASQLQASRPSLDLFDIARALERVAVGIFKVSLLSALFQGMHAVAIARFPHAQTPEERVLAGLGVAVAYPLFLYTNFSGYMDIVIGIGRLFRLTLPENFARPFTAPNFMIFWNRWHMTLSDFFKTYVFNPLLLALMRRFENPSLEPWLAVVAFFVTFFLLGVWHGQTSVFVAYGLVLGLGVSVNKLYQVLLARRIGSRRYKALAKNGLYTAVCRGLTFTYFTFSLFFFWSSWPQMAELLRSVDAGSLALIWLGVLIIATVTLALIETLSAWQSSWTIAGQPVLASRYVRTALTTAVIVVTVAGAVLTNAPAPENIYKAF